MRIFLWCCLLFGNFAFAEQRDVVIRLLEEVSTDHSDVHLVEIANIDGGDIGEQHHQLRNHIVGQSARMGSSKYFTRQEVERGLRGKFPALMNKLSITGSKFTRVDSVGQPVSVSVYSRLAEECLRSWLSERFVRYDVQIVGAQRELAVPLGEVNVEPIDCQFKVGKQMTVLLDVKVDGRSYLTMPVSFHVQIFKRVHVASRQITAATEIKLDDFTLEEKDVAVVQIEGLDVNISQAAGPWRARRNIYAGQILTQALLEPLPDVEKGSEVLVEAKVGSVRVSKEVTAVEDGQALEKVEVKNSITGESFTVTVVGKNKVLAL